MSARESDDDVWLELAQEQAEIDQLVADHGVDGPNEVDKRMIQDARAEVTMKVVSRLLRDKVPVDEMLPELPFAGFCRSGPVTFYEPVPGVGIVFWEDHWVWGENSKGKYTLQQYNKNPAADCCAAWLNASNKKSIIVDGSLQLLAYIHNIVATHGDAHGVTNDRHQQEG